MKYNEIKMQLLWAARLPPFVLQFSLRVSSSELLFFQLY